MKNILIGITIIGTIFLSCITNVYATEIEEPITTTNEPQIEENEEIEDDYHSEIILLLMGILVMEIVGVITR